jgi:WD40 repeat protein
MDRAFRWNQPAAETVFITETRSWLEVDGVMKDAALLMLTLAGWSAQSKHPTNPTFQKVYPLGPREGVFAYARIGPDGRYLAYASQASSQLKPGALTQTVTLVNLSTKRIEFTEPGIDAYFSPDGRRMIFLSHKNGGQAVSIRDNVTGSVTRDIAPPDLGDYFSWAVRDGRNLILTIKGNYYYLRGNQAVMPAGRLRACPGLGRGERPLISRDGKRITTFVRGTLVVRNLTDCSYTLNTGIGGAKADFSWDGRYIAFHALKASGRGYEIQVVDLQRKTVRTISNLPGSSLFPSWTRDGRLSFRYNGEDYRGFMMASNVLSARERPLPSHADYVPAARTWSDIFPETPAPAHPLNLVMVWSTWSAHSPLALRDLKHARRYFLEKAVDVGVLTATDPGSDEEDVKRLMADHGVDLPRIPLAASRLRLTEAHNQVPATLLFRNGRLIARRLGAQSFEEINELVQSVTSQPLGAALRSKDHR